MQSWTGTNAFEETITVNVGNIVEFKSDIEQAGKVIAIRRDWNGVTLTLEAYDCFEGAYIGGEKTADIRFDAIGSVFDSSN